MKFLKECCKDIHKLVEIHRIPIIIKKGERIYGEITDGFPCIQKWDRDGYENLNVFYCPFCGKHIKVIEK